MDDFDTYCQGETDPEKLRDRVAVERRVDNGPPLDNDALPGAAVQDKEVIGYLIEEEFDLWDDKTYKEKYSKWRPPLREDY